MDKMIVENTEPHLSVMPFLYEVVFPSGDTRIVKADTALSAVAKLVCNGSEIETLDTSDDGVCVVSVTSTESLFSGSSTTSIYVKPLLVLG